MPPKRVSIPRPANAKRIAIASLEVELAPPVAVPVPLPVAIVVPSPDSDVNEERDYFITRNRRFLLARAAAAIAAKKQASAPSPLEVIASYAAEAIPAETLASGISAEQARLHRIRDAAVIARVRQQTEHEKIILSRAEISKSVMHLCAQPGLEVYAAPAATTYQWLCESNRSLMRQIVVRNMALYILPRDEPVKNHFLKEFRAEHEAPVLQRIEYESFPPGLTDEDIVFIPPTGAGSTRVWPAAEPITSE